MRSRAGLFSGSVSLLASQRNKATDYQSAPALQLEFAALQHLKSGLAVGLTGYAYKQIKDETGSGADGTRAALGASSLQAQVFGIGPILTYSGADFFGKKINVEFKCYHEFGAKRRFESDSVWARFTFEF
ncbi:MAG: hypothetical protein ACI8R4_000504 [Paracoccaceae bacterium]|jgi:hypothetical protein